MYQLIALRCCHKLIVYTLALGLGLRTKELQFSELRNLDTKDWTIYVDRVKGEGTYGQARTVPIRQEWRDLMSRYLEAREKRDLRGNPYLFPTDLNANGYLSQNSIRIGKQLVEKETGTEFELRACRRTYGQKAIDENLPPESVSLLLGHNTTKTTESYYCRKRPDKAAKKH